MILLQTIECLFYSMLIRKKLTDFTNTKLWKLFLMLTNSPIRPTIPVVDLNRAERFYETI
jgi:hypothetical protein